MIRKDWLLKIGSLDRSFLALSAATILALLLSFVLFRQNIKLAAQVAQLEGAISGPPRAFPGDLVVPFQAINLEGETKSVSYSSSCRKGYIFLIFSPKCRVCDEQFRVWARLVDDINKDRYEMLAVSLDSLEETRRYAQDRVSNFEIISLQDRAVLRAYRVTAIPMTLVVSPAGVTEWVHYGVFKDETYKEVLSIVGHRQ